MFGWFKKAADETVDVIVSEFHAIEDRLVSLADNKFKESAGHLEIMAQAQKDADAARAEADRATAVAAKIRALVS